MTHGLLFLALTAALPAQPLPTVREDLYDIWVREGVKRQQDGRLEAAAVCYRRALEYRSDGAAGLYGLAYCLAHQAQAAEAEQLLRRLLSLHPTHPEAAVLMARLLRGRGAPRKAAEVLTRALAGKPGDAMLSEELGGALVHAGEPRRAIPHLELALRAGADTYRLRLLLGQAYARLPDFVKAEEHLSRALKHVPRDRVAAIQLLDVYLAGGRWLDAVALAERETTLHPSEWRFWWGLGQAGISLADPPRATRGAVAAINLAPEAEQRTLILRAAKTALAADLPDVAVAAILTAPRPDPEMLTYLARGYERQNKWREAAAAWEQASTSRLDLLADAARCWLEAGQKQRALRCLDRLGEKNPAALAEAARLVISMGKPDAAEGYLRQMLARRPHEPGLHLDLAALLAERGRHHLAAQQAWQAQREAPAEAWRVRAAVYLRSGLAEAAAEAYLAAWGAAHRVEDAEAAARLLRELGWWDRLGSLLAAVGKRTDALRVEAGWLALHRGAPVEASKAVGNLATPEAAEVRARARASFGKPEALHDAALALRGPNTDRPALLRVFRAATTADAKTRLAAIDSLRALIADGMAGEDVLDSLDVLLEAEHGNHGKLERWVTLAANAQAPFPIVHRAAELLAEQGRLEGALALLDGRLKQPGTAAEDQLRLLGTASRLCLAAEDIQAAVSYLSRAAALCGQPAVIARLAVLAHTGSLRVATEEALLGLAEAWERGSGETAALFRFMQAASDEADLTAWIAGYQGSQDEKALLQAEQALALGDAEVALARLQAARPGPTAWRGKAEALLRLGRPVEAEPAVTSLLRYAPTPEAFTLAAAVATQLGDCHEAAWWYSRAIAEGDETPALTASLARAAETAQLTPGQRADLAHRASAYAGAAPDRARALQAVSLALGLSQAIPDEDAEAGTEPPPLSSPQ